MDSLDQPWTNCFDRYLEANHSGIIMVGLNQAGKSTLGTDLSKALKIPYVHSGNAPKNEQGIIDCCLEQIEWLDKGYIVDRVTPICHRAYNPNLHKDVIWMLSQLTYVLTKNKTIIYCTTDKSKPIDKPDYPDGHYDDLVERFNEIREMYMSILPSNTIKYDWTIDTIKGLLERVDGRLYR